MPQNELTVLDASAEEAFAALCTDAGAQLVDVRTRAEWAFVGVVNLEAAAKEPILIEWQSFPAMQVEAGFGPALARACPERSAALYFLCRSGGRSLAAARLAATMGYERCHNVTDGFEGPPDAAGHRGTVAGWKAAGLPWRQS